MQLIVILLHYKRIQVSRAATNKNEVCRWTRKFSITRTQDLSFSLSVLSFAVLH